MLGVRSECNVLIQVTRQFFNFVAKSIQKIYLMFISRFFIVEIVECKSRDKCVLTINYE